MALVVKNGRLINPATGEDKICDIRIDGTKITAIGTDVDMQDADILDATGLVVTPGLIDMHVHLRQPGQSAKAVLRRLRPAVLHVSLLCRIQSPSLTVLLSSTV